MNYYALSPNFTAEMLKNKLIAQVDSKVSNFSILPRISYFYYSSFKGNKIEHQLLF
jgi:hypothetical protein